MFKIVNNERLSDNMFRVTFEAPLVARKAQPGQFLMFRVDEFGERMPITISSYDREADRKSTRLNSSHKVQSRMPSSA